MQRFVPSAGSFAILAVAGGLSGSTAASGSLRKRSTLSSIDRMTSIRAQAFLWDNQQRRSYCTPSKPPTDADLGTTSGESAEKVPSGSDAKPDKSEEGTTKADDANTAAKKSEVEADDKKDTEGDQSKEIAAQDNKPGSLHYDPEPFVTGLTKVKWMPLTLIQEVPKPVRVKTDIEILMTAWSEEQAKYFFVFTWAIRALIASIIIFGVWFANRVNKSLSHVLRGTDNMPSGLRIGNVVYLDFEIGGVDAGRVTIGLFNEDCPLYCEYFHRKCTGSGGNSENSFRGLPYVTHQRVSMSFGLGIDMKHDLPGFNQMWLPTEKESTGPWRGAVSSLCYTREKQSPNFQIHLSGGKDTPQIFGMVLSGMETLEKIARLPSSYAGNPLTDVVVGSCGELCTLDKSMLTPLPWSLYQGVSDGYDAVRYGAKVAKPQALAVA